MAEEESSQSASEEPKPGGSQQSSGKPGDLRALIIGATFTLIGGLIGVLGKGCYDLAIEKQKSIAEIQLEEKKVAADLQLETEKSEGNRKLERQKLDADLVKLALQGSGDSRRDSLSFMVETNLIADPDIQKGVKAYLDSKKPVPFLSSSAIGASDHLIDVKSADKRLRAVGVRGPNQIVDVVDGSTGSLVSEFPFPSFWLCDFALSPSGDKIAVFGTDLHSDNTILAKLYAVGPRILIASFSLPWLPDSVKFSDDGRNVVFQHGNENLVFDENGKKVGP
jgi:hypothetical protein